MNKTKQYWIHTKHNGTVGCTNPLWQLTQGKFRDEAAVHKAYEAQAKAFDYEILQVKPHEQFEFALKD
jgi:hypothetical protein